VTTISDNVSEVAQMTVRHGKTSTFLNNLYVRSFE